MNVLLSRSAIATTAALLLGGVLASTPARALCQGSLVKPITIGEIMIHSPEAEELVSRDAKIEVVATGFTWTEGPLWSKEMQCVLFSDIPPNKVYKWKEGEGLSLYLQPSGYTGSTPRGGEPGSNGLMLDNQGRLLLCQHGDMCVARMTAPLEAPAPKFEVLASNYQGKKFNSPNDLVVHSSGAIYFTDPPYGRVNQFADTGRELDFQGVYRIAPDGTVTLLTKEMEAPNGIALSPDEKTLYVSDTVKLDRAFMAYPVKDDGSIGEGRVLFDASKLQPNTPGGPDGMAIDKQGNVFTTGPGGILVLTPEGKHLATIRSGENTSNCKFGGPDGTTLYFTSDMHLCRVQLKTTGLGF